MFNLMGKRALVTGSSQGIGLAMAVCLADYGCEVYVHGSSSREKVQKVTDAIIARGGSAHTTVCDLAVSGCADELYAETGEIDILVLNASFQIRKPWQEITEQDFDCQVNINMKSSMCLMQKYAPGMIQHGFGRIIAVGSVQQYAPHPLMLIYAATKDAQWSFVKNLARQLGPKGITVNSLSPGVILTPRNASALADKAYREKCETAIPLGYIGDAKDLNGALILLASNAGRYINGIDLVVDGGMRL